MSEAITVITASDSRGQPRGFLTKRVSLQGVEKFPYPSLYTSRRVPCGGIRELAGLLGVQASDPHSAVIRGRLLPEAEPVHARTIKSVQDKRTGEVQPAPYGSQDCSALMLDIDKLPLQEVDKGYDGSTLPQVICRRIILKYLPVSFHGVSYYWRLSSSHGYVATDEPVISVHLWFWLSRPASDEEMRRFIQLQNHAVRMEYHRSKGIFDPTLYDPVHLHFTADPILVEGVRPLAHERGGLDEFDRQVVPIGLELDVEKGAWERWLLRIGEDKEGFYGPIIKAAASHVHEFGKPAPVAREALKEKIRQAVDLADKGARSPSYITEKVSDDFLDPAIDGAVDKGFGQAKVDEAATAASGDYLWVRDVSKYYHKKNRVFQTAEGVRLEYGSSKDITRNKHFLEHLQRVDRVQTVPGKRDCLVIDEGQAVWSNWPGRKVEPTYGDVGWLLEHVSFICADTPEAEQPFLNWFANLVGNPGQRALWAVVIGSTYGGIGKTMIADLLDELIYGVKPLSNNDLTEKYKDYADTELAICAEVKLSEKLNATDLLKSIISDNKLHIRKFGKPHAVMTLYCHHFFTTNYKDALPLQQGGDRRYLVIWNEQKPRDREYYRQLGEHIKKHGSDVLGWALERCRTMRFDRYAPPPVTGHALAMAERSRSADEQVILEALRDRQPPFDFKVAFGREVRLRVGQVLQVRLPSSQKLADLFRGEARCDYLRINGPNEHGARVTHPVYVIDDGKEGLIGRPHQELFEMAQAESRSRAEKARRRRIEEAEDTAVAVAEAKARRLRLVDPLR